MGRCSKDWACRGGGGPIPRDGRTSMGAWSWGGLRWDGGGRSLGCRAGSWGRRAGAYRVTRRPPVGPGRRVREMEGLKLEEALVDIR